MQVHSDEAPVGQNWGMHSSAGPKPGLARRVAAFALDSGFVAVLSALVIRSQAESFPSDYSLASAEQLDRLRELEQQSLHRLVALGDTHYVFPGTGFLLSVLIPLVLALIIFVLLPATTGWSPGKRLFGLRVVTTDGDAPSLGQHLVRSVVGIVDLMPVVIPGLLGIWRASRDPLAQRLGDSAAKTTVIDARAPATPAVETNGIDVSGRLGEIELDEASDDAGDIVSREAASPDSQLAETSSSDDPSVDDALEEALPAEREPAEREPAEREPAEREPAEREPAETPDDGEPQIDFDLAPPERTDLFATSLPPAHQFPDPDDEETKREVRLPPPPIHRSDWDQPVGEPAPVWRPDEPTRETEPGNAVSDGPDADAGEHSEEHPKADPGPDELVVEEQAPTDEDAPDENGEPVANSAEDAGSGETVAATASAEEAREAREAKEAREPRPAVAPPPAERPEPESPQPAPAASSAVKPAGSGAIDPVWDENWQSWLYWDGKSERWLRHDADANVWVPIS